MILVQSTQTPFNANNSAGTTSGTLLTFHQRNAHHLHSSSSHLSEAQLHVPSTLQQHHHSNQMQQSNVTGSSVDTTGYSTLQSQLLQQSLQLHNINLHPQYPHSMVSGELSSSVSPSVDVCISRADVASNGPPLSPFVSLHSNQLPLRLSNSTSRNKNLTIHLSTTGNQVDSHQLTPSYVSSSTLTSVSSLSSQYSDEISDNQVLLSTASQSNVDDFDDLKLLDFPFQDTDAFDETSLDEMLSPTPSSVATFDATICSSAPPTPTTTCSSSYAPSPVTTPIPFACPPNAHQSVNLCNTFQPANDIILTAVTATASTTSSSSVISTPLPPESPIYSSRPGSSCHTPSSGISVTSSSPISTNCLPSFMDAYSTISTAAASDSLANKMSSSTMSPRVPMNTPVSSGGHFTHRNDEPYFKFEALMGDDFSVSDASSSQQLSSMDLFSSIKQEPLDDASHQVDLSDSQDVSTLAHHRRLLLGNFVDQVSPPKRPCHRVFDSDSLDLSTGCMSSHQSQSMLDDQKPLLLKSTASFTSPGGGTSVASTSPGQMNLSLPLSESTQCSFSSTCSSPPATASAKVSKEASCNPLNHPQNTQSTSSVVCSKSHSICAVCGDSAACQHYGVRTCEGCKGFFKRTVQKAAKYTCLGSKDCVVDKRRRNRCQFCRFQKCLSVGMVKEVVRTDELKGRRGRLPSKPKSPQASPPSPPVSTITALVRAHLDTNPDCNSLEASQSSQVLNETVNEDLVLRFYSIVTSSFEAIRSFAERIPSFVDLEKEDQEKLFHCAALELFSLRFAHRNTSDSDRMLFCSGSSLHRSQVETVIGSKWLHSMGNISRILTSMDIDISAFACLSALSIVTERPGLKNGHRVEQLQMKILNSLRDHCTYNRTAQNKVNYLSRILNILSELRSVSVDAVHRLNRLNDIVTMPNSFASLFASTSSSVL